MCCSGATLSLALLLLAFAYSVAEVAQPLNISTCPPELGYIIPVPCSDAPRTICMDCFGTNALRVPQADVDVHNIDVYVRRILDWLVAIFMSFLVAVNLRNLPREDMG